MSRILLMVGLVLMVLSKLNPVISGPYVRNIEQHQLFDTILFVLGALLLIGSLGVRLLKKRP